MARFWICNSERPCNRANSPVHRVNIYTLLIKFLFKAKRNMLNGWYRASEVILRDATHIPIFSIKLHHLSEINTDFTANFLLLKKHFADLRYYAVCEIREKLLFSHLNFTFAIVICSNILQLAVDDISNPISPGYYFLIAKAQYVKVLI